MDQGSVASVEAGIDEKIKLPAQLEKVRKAVNFSGEQHRWNTNEEVASILVAFSKHPEWLKREVTERPPSGCLFLYNRKELRYRRDGYCWKKRKDGKTAREDHMKLKVHGIECIYGSYVHSAILPTFHRRCYWLLQNADVVLVHYLNVPLTDDNKLGIPMLSVGADNKNWSEEELQSQLRPMFASMKHFDPSEVTEHLMEETIKHMVSQLMERDTVFTHDCTCQGDVQTCSGKCKGTRIITPKVGQSSVQSRLISYIQQSQKPMNRVGSSTIPSMAGGIQPNLTVAQGAPENVTLGHPQSVMVNTVPAKLPNTPHLTQHLAAQGQVPGHSPLILNLSHLPGSNGLIILSSQAANPISFINNNLAASQNSGSNTTPSYSISSAQSGQPTPPSTSSGTLLNTQSVLNSHDLQQHNGGQSHSHFHGQLPIRPHTGFQTRDCDLQNNLQNSLSGGQTQEVPSSSYRSFNCDRIVKSEEKPKMISLLNVAYSRSSTQPTPDSVCSSTMGFDSTDLHNTQDMDTSLDLLESTLLSLSSESPKQDIHGMVPATKPNIGNLDPSQQADFDSVVNSALRSIDQQHGSSFDRHIIDPLSTDCLSSLPTSIPSPGDQDLNFDHFDILDLPEFDTINLSPSLTSSMTSSVVSSVHAPITSTLPVKETSATTDNQASSFVHDVQHVSYSQHGQDRGSLGSEPQSVSAGTPVSASTAVGSCVNCSSKQKSPDYSRAGIAKITDLAPDWAFAEGGSKVLVTGPWYSSTSPYTVYFNDICVPAHLVQSGVLRCYCPSHDAGLVKLQVACEGYVISDPRTFEYKLPLAQAANPGSLDPFSIKENELKSSILTKLRDIETHMATVPWGDKNASNIHAKCSKAIGTPGFENALVECCRILSHRVWIKGSDLVPPAPLRLTLLHLAAALGYSSVINELIKWRFKSPCLLLQFEVDALSRDDNACTPLMWACAFGHHDAILLLYQWIPAALQISNKDGLDPLTLATSRGYQHIAQQLEQMEVVRKQQIANVINKHLADRKRSPSHQDAPLPGDASQALAVIKFAMPSIPARQQQKCVGSNSSGRRMGTTAQGVPSSSGSHNQGYPRVSGGSSSSSSSNNMGNLQIEIPPSQPPYLIQHKHSKPFNSAQNTPKSASCTTLAGTNVNFGGVLANSEVVNLQNSVPSSRRTRLMKRTSVEVLPDFPLADLADNSKCTKTHSTQNMPREVFVPRSCQSQSGQILDVDAPVSLPSNSPLRSASSDPHISAFTTDEVEASISRNLTGHDLHGRSQSCADPMISMCDRDLNSPLMFLHMEGHQGLNQTGLTLEEIQRETVDMETDSPRSVSPSGMNQLAAEVASNKQSESDCENLQQDHQMITLANQIIAAIPERIKYSPGPGEELITDEMIYAHDRRSSYSSYSSTSSIATPPGVAEESGISTPLDGMALEECRYPDLSTPASSVSPASSCLPSPYHCFSMDSPPPTTAEFTEYFNAPSFYLEKDFSQLTLTDEEQRRLYEAAQIIQNFYRRYKDKKELQQRQQQKEMEAAILIQSYYRRYKQYLYYKKMTQAAVLIQSQFRSYYAQKRFRKSREAATIIQNRYRAYKEHERFKKSHSAMIQQRFRCHYQRKRDGSLTDKVEELMEDAELNSEVDGTEKTRARSSEHDPAPANTSNGGLARHNITNPGICRGESHTSTPEIRSVPAEDA